MSKLWAQAKHLTPYQIHKLIINEYVLKHPGDASLLCRDTSRDKNDYDVLRENHKFLWSERDAADSWERQYAKRYYDKLFKEYCIGDLRLYKDNKLALRWRTEKEVISGKGQFICGNKTCAGEEELRTWEVNFAYIEDDTKKNALVKIRLCPDCSMKLNYRSKKREIKRLKKPPKKDTKKKLRQSEKEIACSSQSSAKDSSEDESVAEEVEESPWEQQKQPEIKSRETEMEEYLNDLLF